MYKILLRFPVRHKLNYLWRNETLWLNILLLNGVFVYCMEHTTDSCNKTENKNFHFSGPLRCPFWGVLYISWCNLFYVQYIFFAESIRFQLCACSPRILQTAEILLTPFFLNIVLKISVLNIYSSLFNCLSQMHNMHANKIRLQNLMQMYFPLYWSSM